MRKCIADTDFMQKAGYEDIPSEALKVFELAKQMQKDLTHLDQVANIYNEIVLNANEVETALLQTQIAKVDEMLVRGENDLTWKDVNGTLDVC